MLKRPLSALLAAASLSALLVSGCGVDQLAGHQLQQSQFGASAKKLKYGLGANLKGAAKVKYDEDTKEAVPGEEMAALAALPTKVDLRGKMPPIYNQGPMGSCTGFAIAKGLGEYILKKQNRHTELSALYLYYQERKVHKTLDEDSGAAISVGMKILDNLGCAPEKDHPYMPEKEWNSAPSLQKYLTMKPDNSDVAAGKKFRVAGLKPITSLRGIRNSLHKGMPVVFGITLYESFQSAKVAKTGVVPMPDQAKEQTLGGHAVVAVGYDNAKQMLIMRNSWGKEWGDRGYFYLPYDYIREGLAADAWTAKI